MATLQKITSNLWFDNEAEEAVKYYTSIFASSSIGKITRFGNTGQEIHGRPAGSVMTIEFTLNGHPFMALNGGPDFKFNEAVSFIISCQTQEEVDYYWDKLKEGGDPQALQCGWLKDKFGLSWQVVPVILDEMFIDADQQKVDRVMSAMLQMKKLDIAALQKAYKG